MLPASKCAALLMTQALFACHGLCVEFSKGQVAWGLTSSYDTPFRKLRID